MAAPRDWHTLTDGTVIAVDISASDDQGYWHPDDKWVFSGGQRHPLSAAAYASIGSPAVLMMNSGDIYPIPVGTPWPVQASTSTTTTTGSGSTQTTSTTPGATIVVGGSLPIWGWIAIGLAAYTLVGRIR